MRNQKSILDNVETVALPEETFKEMFRQLNTLIEGTKEYNELVEKLVMHNLRLIPTFGKNYLNNFTVDELISMCWNAVDKAVRGYDVNSGVPFASYAKYWITTELKRNAYMEYMPYTLSKREYEMLCKYYALCARFEVDNNKEPEFEDIYPLMGLSERQVKNLAGMLDISLHYTLDNTIDDENDTTLLDRVASYDTNPYSGSEIVKSMLSTLEYDILMGYGEGYSIKQLAIAFEMDASGIKSILNEARAKCYNMDVYDALTNTKKE